MLFLQQTNHFLSFPFLASIFIVFSHVCLSPVWGSWWFRDLGDLSVKECLVNSDTLRTVSLTGDSISGKVFIGCDATSRTAVLGQSLLEREEGLSAHDVRFLLP